MGSIAATFERIIYVESEDMRSKVIEKSPAPGLYPTQNATMIIFLLYCISGCQSQYICSKQSLNCLVAPKLSHPATSLLSQINTLANFIQCPQGCSSQHATAYPNMPQAIAIFCDATVFMTRLLRDLAALHQGREDPLQQNQDVLNWSLRTVDTSCSAKRPCLQKDIKWML